MPRRRFRLLQPAEPQNPGSAPSRYQRWRRRFRRKLERDGALRSGSPGAFATHFCRSCESESPADLPRCRKCGAPLGGEGQAAFDRALRRELSAASARDAPVPRESAVPAPPSPAEARVVAPAPRPHLANVALLCCIFATVAATGHLFATALFFQPVPWGIGGEVFLCAVVTFGVLRWLRGTGWS